MQYSYLFFLAVLLWAALPWFLSPNARHLSLPPIPFSTALVSLMLIFIGLHDGLVCLSELDSLRAGRCAIHHRQTYLFSGVALLTVSVIALATLRLATRRWLRRIGAVGLLACHIGLGIGLFTPVLLLDPFSFGQFSYEAADARMRTMAWAVDAAGFLVRSLIVMGLTLTVVGLIALRLVRRRDAL